MNTTEDWLKQKLIEYNENPTEALEDMLHNTVDIMEQYIKCPDSHASKGLLEVCMEHNKKFLQIIYLKKKLLEEDKSKAL